MAPSSEVARAYRDVLDYLDGFQNYERRPPTDAAAYGTARMSALLAALGNPQDDWRAVHIAGTKGKGSTATLTAALLQACGLRVGLYTSPHLVSVRERIVIGGAPVSRETFCDAFRCLQPALDGVAADPTLGPATYFETLTALAFVAFQREGVDVAVVEVGLGGRLDATNVLSPVACAIASLSLDHEAVLGDTLPAIAAEKAGILKEDTPAVFATQPDEAMEVLRERAVTVGAPYRTAGTPELSVEILSDLDTLRPEDPMELHVSTWRGRYGRVRLPLLGAHQAANAALAIGLAEIYLESRRAGGLSEGLINRAWRTVQAPARLELVGHRPWVLLDGAHNPASAWALAETIRQRFRPERIVLLFGAARDKNIAGMLRILAPLADRTVTVPIGHSRGADPDDLAVAIRDDIGASVLAMDDIASGFQAARELAGEDGLVCIAGSLYLAGGIQRLLHPDGQD